MTIKYKTPQQEPSAYRLALDCGHSPILTPQRLKELYVESRFEPTTGHRHHTDVIVCPDCREMKPGHCDYTPLHKVIMATPMFSRQVQQQEEQQQPKQQPQEGSK
jgi:hypothetical protein